VCASLSFVNFVCLENLMLDVHNIDIVYMNIGASSTCLMEHSVCTMEQVRVVRNKSSCYNGSVLILKEKKFRSKYIHYPS
jgi:hypothetical protein